MEFCCQQIVLCRFLYSECSTHHERNPDQISFRNQKSIFIELCKTGKFDKKYGKLLSELFEWRQKGDYENIFDYDDDSVQPLFEPVREMIELIEKAIKNTL